MKQRLFSALMALLVLAACDSGSTDPVGGDDTFVESDVVACVPQCDGKVCGDDGCGGLCGECPGCDGPDDSLCTDDGTLCIQVCCPLCEPGQECGDDGCGDLCGDGCAENETCEAGACVCTPDCNDPCAIDDGCGERCNACPAGQSCSLAGQCQTELLDCIEYVDCISDCPDNDAVCVHESCDSQVAPEAFEAHGLFVDCMFRNYDDCAEESPMNPEPCMISRCTTEYYACYSRDQSCSDVLTCIADCEESSCENPCKTEGTAEAQIAMDDLRICVNQACIGEYPFPGDSCWDEAVAAGGDCAAEYAICVGD